MRLPTLHNRGTNKRAWPSLAEGLVIIPCWDLVTFFLKRWDCDLHLSSFIYHHLSIKKTARLIDIFLVQRWSVSCDCQTIRNGAKITMNRLQKSAMRSNEIRVYIIVKNQTTDVELQCHTLLEYLFASISPVFVVNPILGHLTDINSIWSHRDWPHHSFRSALSCCRAWKVCTSALPYNLKEFKFRNRPQSSTPL